MGTSFCGPPHLTSLQRRLIERLAFNQQSGRTYSFSRGTECASVCRGRDRTFAVDMIPKFYHLIPCENFLVGY